MPNPYSNLSSEKFWRTGVVDSNPLDLQDIYRKKFYIKKSDKIATAGSCFASNIFIHLKKNNFNLIEVEKAPRGLPYDSQRSYGFNMFSARYGNIYTVHQLYQLALEAYRKKIFKEEEYILKKENKYFDAFRPNINPSGFNSATEVISQRESHIENVKKVFDSLDVLIFTFGLTESWKFGDINYPSAHDVFGAFKDNRLLEFKNYSFNEIYECFQNLRDLINDMRNKKNPVKFILTVSPVPLTATASKSHILSANAYSKATLRSIAGQLADNDDNIDYFPSYEIITNPNLRFTSYENNLRTVSQFHVSRVMDIFFSEHSPDAVGSNTDDIQEIDENCDEALLEAFNKEK